MRVLRLFQLRGFSHPAPGNNGQRHRFRTLDQRLDFDPLVAAVRAHAQPESWRRLMRTAMAQDFSWNGSAAGYVALYRRLLGGRE